MRTSRHYTIIMLYNTIRRRRRRISNRFLYYFHSDFHAAVETCVIILYIIIYETAVSMLVACSSGRIFPRAVPMTDDDILLSKSPVLYIILCHSSVTRYWKLYAHPCPVLTRLTRACPCEHNLGLRPTHAVTRSTGPAPLYIVRLLIIIYG